MNCRSGLSPTRLTPNSARSHADNWRPSGFRSLMMDHVGSRESLTSSRIVTAGSKSPGSSWMVPSSSTPRSSRPSRSSARRARGSSPIVPSNRNPLDASPSKKSVSVNVMPIRGEAEKTDHVQDRGLWWSRRRRRVRRHVPAASSRGAESLGSGALVGVSAALFDHPTLRPTNTSTAGINHGSVSTTGTYRAAGSTHATAQFERVQMQPSEARRLTVTADPRLPRPLRRRRRPLARRCRTYTVAVARRPTIRFSLGTPPVGTSLRPLTARPRSSCRGGQASLDGPSRSPGDVDARRLNRAALGALRPFRCPRRTHARPGSDPGNLRRLAVARATAAVA